MASWETVRLFSVLLLRGYDTAPAGEAYEAYPAFLVPGFVYQKGIWANEGTSDSIVNAYREAIGEIAHDEEFLSASEDVLGGYPLYPGDMVEDDLMEASSISDGVRQYTLDMLADEYDVVVDSK